MAARYYIPQSYDRRRGWLDHEGGASLKESEAILESIGIAEAYSTLTRVIRKPVGWKPSGAITFVDVDNNDISSERLEDHLVNERVQLQFAEERERVADQRKHEKKRRRAETSKARQPTAWDHLLREDGL